MAMRKRVSFDERFMGQCNLYNIDKNIRSNDKLKQLLFLVMKDSLTEKQKKYLVMYYIEKTDMPTISLICGVNKSTVSRTIARARRRLYEKMKYYFDLKI